MDDDLRNLVLTSVRQALERPAGEVPDALAEFGWRDLAAEDEAFAFTALFEAQGYASADAGALDLAAATALDLEVEITVVWPHRAAASGRALGDRGRLAVDGVAQRSLRDGARRTVVPVGARLHVLASPALDETDLGGMASGRGWVRARGEAASAAEVGSWPEVERRCALALASELVGGAQRILDVATEQVSERRQFGRPIGTYQAVRFRLAEAYAEVVGARAFVAAAWEDGSIAAARWAKAAAAGAHDAVAKHAIQVCGAIGLDEEHALPALVRRGFALDALLGADDGASRPPLVPVAHF